ncbi:phytanoyl-CoA dioxygenase family protein [Fimbriimonas ginsengisoli]|uniref:Phytanoyl-CoA dioxygenase n=1 Tax=Fimbriimonas ginsengisoli Gsoil 348 TaxID=661478 RepID=A0A068NLR0_FIMGI|nr:phytanoyl-CoA dioxygenase family protein [Fimbriimonas ginsengisoli]AIE84488.1 phytanoyl-CoA dioxygenase [Fimbriimonas ginsengisoli Gsoil 348]
MKESALQHLLTDGERHTFETTGLLVVEDALSPQQVAELTQATDRIYAARLASGGDPKAALFHPNFIPDDPLFQELVDYDRVLPKVWGILGWNIYLYHAHLIVTPPTGQAPDNKTFGWHQDSGRVNREIETHPRPRLSLKVAYFLSDVSMEGRGNFWVVPGSQLSDSLPMPPDGVGQPDGAVPVLVKAGSAVLFDRRLWHTASPNWSDVTRKVLFYGYGYRWIRTKDDMTVQSLWPNCDPIRKQLLGFGETCNGFYTPQDADVPLRVWLREHSPGEAE